MRISASLVGAGRGNGAIAEPKNRTTSLSEVREDPFYIKYFRVALIWYQHFVSSQDYGSSFTQGKEKNR